MDWMTTLKLLPWSEVIEAAPQVLRAARKLLRTSRKGKAEAEPETRASDSADSSEDTAANQLQALQQRVEQLEQEQVDSSRLIQSLAEQNARLVVALEAMRVRQQRLQIAIGSLAFVGIGLVVEALLRWGG